MVVLLHALAIQAQDSADTSSEGVIPELQKSFAQSGGREENDPRPRNGEIIPGGTLTDDGSNCPSPS